MSQKKGNAVAVVIKAQPAKKRQFNTGPILTPQYVGTAVTNLMIGVVSATGPNPNDWYYNNTEIDPGPNNIQVIAPGSVGWLEGTITRTVQGVRAKPKILWKVKANWKMHEQVTLDNVKAGINRAGLTHDYDPIFEITAPANGTFVAPGNKVAVTLAIKPDDCFVADSATRFVAVLKDTPVIKWSVPVPIVAVGTTLSGDHLSATTQLDKIGVNKPVVVYNHKEGKQLTEAKPLTITASFAGNALFNAAIPVSITLKVVADQSAIGIEAMKTGQAFKRAKSGPKKTLLDNWDNDNAPTGIKATCQKVMADIKAKTGEEIEDYMDSYIAPKGSPPIGTRNPPGPTPPYPDPTGKVVNIIWELSNGMQVRYKPYGDDAAVKGPPMFCIEGKTCVGPSTNDKQVAFKVTMDGHPGAYGPKQTLLPPGIPENKNDLKNQQYMDGACGTTHLACKPKTAQTITWNTPPDLNAGEELGKKTLSATADDPASLRYTDDQDQPVTETTVPAAKKGQILKVTSVETKKYLPTTIPVTVTININRKAQTIKWAPKVTSVFAEAELGGDVLNAVADDPKAVLTYTDGTDTVITKASKLAAKKGHVLKVTASETDLYNAVTTPVTATIDIDLRPQSIAWTPKVKTIFAEAELGADVLNAAPDDPRAVLTYTDDQDKVITAKSTLAAKKGQVLKVTAAATTTHAAVTTPVTATIDIDLRPQSIAWTPKVKTIFAEAELGADVLNAAPDDPRAVLTYTDDQDKVITAKSTLAAKKGQVLKVTAAATTTHAAVTTPVTATIDIDLRPQSIAWTPKVKTIFAEAELGADVLNAAPDDPRAVLTYTDDQDKVITAKSTLAAKKGQVLKVTAGATTTHAAVTTPVTATIDIDLRPQSIAWTPKTLKIPADTELGKDVLNAVPDDPRAVLTYTDDQGKVITETTKLAAKKGQVLKVTAAATTTHAAVTTPVTATIDVETNSEQTK